MIDAKIYHFTPSTEASQCGIDMNTVGVRQVFGCTKTTPRSQPLKATDYRFLYLRHNPFKENEKKTVFFLYPGDDHPGAEVLLNEYEEFWIGFRGLLSDRIIADFSRYNKTDIIHTEVDKKIHELFQKAISVSEAQSDDMNLLLVGILMQMLGMMIYQQNIDYNKFVQEDLNNKIQEAKQMMHKHVYDNISSKQVADHIGMGYDNFRRLFKNMTGISPGLYIQNIRIDKAKNMLLHSTDSIKEISYLLNFENPCYFSKAFRKKEGVSPAEYRYSVQHAV